MTDIVERLRGCIRPGYLAETIPAETLQEASEEIERLRGLLEKVGRAAAKVERECQAEVEDWKERWAAERRDHEATIRHFDKLMNEVPT